MALESSVTNIADLNKAWPLGSDPKSSMDDHLRNLKTAMLNGFAGFTGSVMVTGTDGGAVNAYTLTPANPLPAYSTKMVAVFAPTVANTGAVTLNISGLGAQPVVSVSGAPLVANDLTVGGIYAAFYDGTAFRLLSVTKNYVDQLAFNNALPAQSLGFLRSDGTVTGFTTSHTGYAVNESLGAAIASSATVNLTTATGNLVHITGTTTITAITIPVGAERTVIFDSSLTLTHGAALLLPGAANITTAAGDRMTVRGDTAGAVVVSYTRANGLPVQHTAYALTLLATLTPTAAANIDFLNVFSSTYNDYRIVVSGVRPSSPGSNNVLRLRLASGGAALGSGDAALTGTASAITGVSAGFSVADVRNVNSASIAKMVQADGIYHNSGGTDGISTERYFYEGLTTVSGFRLFWSAGTNFDTTGTVHVYGYQKS